MMSFEPPAAKLTMKCTGRSGYFSCARAGASARQRSDSKATQNRMMRMASLPGFDLAVGGCGDLASLRAFPFCRAGKAKRARRFVIVARGHGACAPLPALQIINP